MFAGAGDDARAEVFVEVGKLGIGVSAVEFDAPAVARGEGEGELGALGFLRADLLADAQAGDGVERGGEDVALLQVEHGEGGVEFVLEEGALEAGLVLLAFLQ